MSGGTFHFTIPSTNNRKNVPHIRLHVRHTPTRRPHRPRASEHTPATAATCVPAQTVRQPEAVRGNAAKMLRRPVHRLDSVTVDLTRCANVAEMVVATNGLDLAPNTLRHMDAFISAHQRHVHHMQRSSRGKGDMPLHELGVL